MNRYITSLRLLSLLIATWALAPNAIAHAQLSCPVSNATCALGGDVDTDCDIICDGIDDDDDNDGIPDSEEGNGVTDTDGDGTPDSKDLDSDGDGVNDVDEAGYSQYDPDGDGRVGTNLGIVNVDIIGPNGIHNEIRLDDGGGTTDCESISDHLVNSSFELPALVLTSRQVDENNVPGWETTAADGLIEIWDSGHMGVDAPIGDQFAEINGTGPQRLFQSFGTTIGQAYQVVFFHRGRNGTDQARLLVDGAEVAVFSSDDSDWTRQTYNFTATSMNTTVGFETVSPSGSEGNFLDVQGVYERCALPDTDNDGTPDYKETCGDTGVGPDDSCDDSDNDNDNACNNECKINKGYDGCDEADDCAGMIACGSDMICGGDDAMCTTNDDCVGVCVNGMCQGAPDPGDACDEDDDCPGDAVCFEDTCQFPDGTGDCNNGNAGDVCISDMCMNGECSGPCGDGTVDDGEVCDDGDDNGPFPAACSLTCQSNPGGECTDSDDCSGGALCTSASFCDFDTDGDGIPDADDGDADGDGIPNITEGGGTDPTLDSDSDGTPDYADSDANGFVDENSDGIDDRFDFDGDGIPNHRDRDSDNDGITDTTEGGGTDADGNGRLDDCTDGNGNGVCDSTETTPLPVPNTDNEGAPDFIDSDSDGDGLSDVFETGGVDDDNDGIPDDFEDTNGDGFLDSPVIDPRDSEGDGRPDYRDPDDDNDNIPTAIEVVDAARVDDPDPDGDNIPPYLDQNSDGDAASDLVEGGVDPTLDLDDDGIPDYLDPDSVASDTDGDGVADQIECPPDGPVEGVTCPDTDNDGTPDYQDVDDDGDGLLTREELLDGDTDQDGMRNYLDPDDDNDSAPTEGEHDNGTRRDTDQDGIDDHLDPDDDNDGIDTFDEISDSTALGNPDVDDDGNANWYDTDADGDGVDDGTEGRGDDDGDGIPNYLDPDDGNQNGDGGGNGDGGVRGPFDFDGEVAGGALGCRTSQGPNQGWLLLGLLSAALVAGRRRRQ